jgi:hypothetical protein
MSTKKTPWDKENPEQEAQREASNDNDPVAQMKAQAEAMEPVAEFTAENIVEAYKLGLKRGQLLGKLQERGRLARLMKDILSD